MKYDIRLSAELWATRLMPEGLVEKWHVPDGKQVAKGEALAAVRIEGALHEVPAPCDGRLSIATRENAVVEPGAILATIEAAR